MRVGQWKKVALCLALVMWLSLVSTTLTVQAERLPIKVYTTADGLAHNAVYRVVRDSRGFLWFCTGEGLSRFDGYSFTNYGIEQGLPSASVNDLLETREGSYWAATAGGLAGFNPKGSPVPASIRNPQSNSTHRVDRNPQSESPMFAAYFPDADARSKHVLSLLQDRAGVIWCGTRNGLYRVEATASEVKFTLIDLGIPNHFESRFIECLLEDRLGALWVGSCSGLYRRWPDGRVEAYTTRDGLPDNVIHSLLEDREGRIWVGAGWGWLCRLVPDPAPGRKVVARVYSDEDGLPAPLIFSLFQASDGSLWAGSNNGLIQFIPTADGRDFRFRAYAQAHGLSYQEVNSVAEDRNGNLWVGIGNGGAAKIARRGFTTFGKADGFSQSTSIFETRAGDVLVVGTPGEGEWFINRFDGEKFLPIRPQFPAYVKRSGYGWGWNQTVLEDHTGEWWIASAAGVCRFPKVSKPEQLAHTPPKAIYTTRDGLAADVILRLFEDSRGDVWIGSVGHGIRLNGLSRWERRTGVFHHYTERDHLPRFDTFYVSSFAEDRAGNLWIGFSGEGGLVRYRDGRFTLFTANDGVPTGQIRNMLVDSAGRLWVATYQGGLSRIDDPAAERPRLVTYTTADGLSSNEIAGVSEDEWGRIYIGTGRGIDRLDLTTGRIKHYTMADGLPLGGMYATLRDRKGTLWFSFAVGVARLIPGLDPPPVPPPVLITGLHIAGKTQPISALGETTISLLNLAADKNQLQIDFVGLSLSPGEWLRYQYQLVGADRDWSTPTDQRTINYASLSPGAYRFLVRAVSADGIPSSTPASVDFTILPPMWQRWWFLALAIAFAGLFIYAIYRYRLARLVELERVRTRIAADLHDDIGTGLSQMALLSDVVKRQIRSQQEASEDLLTDIARTGRELVDAMSDIVWAIDPRRDDLKNVVYRVRQLATDALDIRGIRWEFLAPEASENVKLNPEQRRHIYLIFKEAITNIVRHADCGSIRLSLNVSDHRLVAEIRDDGAGFAVSTSSDPSTRTRGGNGLVNMRARAAELGGQVEIESSPGGGTRLTLSVPLK